MCGAVALAYISPFGAELNESVRCNWLLARLATRAMDQGAVQLPDQSSSSFRTDTSEEDI